MPTTAGEGEGRQPAGQPQPGKRWVTLPKQDPYNAAHSWEGRNNHGVPHSTLGQQIAVQPHDGKARVLPKRTAVEADTEDVSQCRGKPT